MNPDVMLNFAANLFIGVGLGLCWPLCKTTMKRIGLIGLVAAAFVNVTEMVLNDFHHADPGELLLNCMLAFNVVVFVASKRADARKH